MVSRGTKSIARTILVHPFDVSSVGSLTGTTTLTYNVANELMSINYPGNRSLAFTYIARGERTQSVNQSGSADILEVRLAVPYSH